MAITLQSAVTKLIALEQLNLCESEARQMVTDTIDIYNDYRVNDEFKDETEQLKQKLLALSVYYPQYFGYDPELMSNINDTLYAKEDEDSN